jgi:phosphopantetheinyl transferase
MVDDRNPVVVLTSDRYVVYHFEVPSEVHFRQFIDRKLRQLIGEKLDISPEKLEFSTKNQGKPIVRASQNHLRLSFNLSHSDGKVLVGIAVPRDHHHSIEIGVDVQRKRPTPILKLARRFFHPREVLRLEAGFHFPSTLPSSTREEVSISNSSTREEVSISDSSSSEEVNISHFSTRQRCIETQEALFFRYWTLKEAWVKCRGENLASHLKLDIDKALAGFTVHEWNDDSFAYAVVIKERARDDE